MLRDEMNQLIKKLSDSLSELDAGIETILANNRQLIQEIDIANEDTRKEIIELIHSSSKPGIELLCTLQDIELNTPDGVKAIKHIIQKPLAELSDEECNILKYTIKNIDVKLLLTSDVEQIAKLGQAINYLQGTDAHKQRTLKKIADAFSLMNLYHDAKDHESKPSTPRPRSGSIDKSRSALRNSASALSRSLGSLRLSSPRKKGVANLFEKRSPALYEKLEDIKLDKSPKSGRK